MKEPSAFDAGPDRELGELVREYALGPAAPAFEARLRATLGRLPERTSQWDVLAGWARPGVVAAAAAAGFLLGLTLWQSWRERAAHAGTPASVSVALLEPTQRAVEPIIYTVLEEQ
ncbi:MAG: hypothetical protein JNJ80_09510 [Gemmatimonadetes bacterium]|nr:hypothetical protein [Gemmatimonadota bacterium]MCC7134220.1 hypothetical protein [Gemmatimonadales bacterium]